MISIVGHPGDGVGGRISNGTTSSYITTSYIKFVEATKAHIIPLIYNEPEERILEVMPLLPFPAFPCAHYYKQAL
jgi:gamma-glutamyl hydrolase